MDGAELVGVLPSKASPTTNSPGGIHLTETVSNQLNNPIHMLQENEGINWIVIDQDVAYDFTNSYFEQIREPNGDIHLRFVDIFNSSKNNNSRPQPTTEADDQGYRR